MATNITGKSLDDLINEGKKKQSQQRNKQQNAGQGQQNQNRNQNVKQRIDQRRQNQQTNVRGRKLVVGKQNQTYGVHRRQ